MAIMRRLAPFHPLKFVLALSWIGVGADASRANPERPPNVLLITVDDLRPALGCYGDDEARTPHIDRLAGGSVVFRRAYCQVASCCPSRTSMLTGLRPRTTGVVSNGSPHFRQSVPEHTTLPQLFRERGWYCREFGKVFHRRDGVSFSEPKWIPETEFAYPIYGDPQTRALQRTLPVTRKPDDWWGASRWVKALSHEAPDVPDEALFDGMLARRAVETLREKRDEPFFLAVGFFRPHLPFVAPKKYYDLYPPESIRLPANRQPPENAPEAALHDSPELRSYVDISKREPFSEELQKELLRAYRASVSYVDAQIGLLLDELQRLRLSDKTIVVLVSDHGYHLGEHGLWNKYTAFEEATRSVLIVRAPGYRPGVSDGLLELLDIYPTLAELAGLSPPDNLEGESFVRQLRDPAAEGKPAAFSRVDRRGLTGDAIRTDRFRYVQWRRGEQVAAEELYDHQSDPGENRNVAADHRYRNVLQRLSQQLAATRTRKGS